MILDYGPNRLRPDALSGLPGTLLDAEPRRDLAFLAEIDMIENGDPAARRNWQGGQLVNLMRHACDRSPFWRKRILSRALSPQTLKFLPVLTRSDVGRQVDGEGSLMPTRSGEQQMTYASSGSTGTPVKVHVTPQNVRYNSMRSLAQMFIEGRDLDLNRVQAQFLDGLQTLDGIGMHVEKTAGWLGSLNKVFQGGHNKKIMYVFDRVDALAEELLKDPVGYLVCAGGHIDNLIQFGGVDLLKRAQVRHWIQFSDGKDSERCDVLRAAGISTLANYSSAEVGPIGFECGTTPFHFHVAHSNVLVETDASTTMEIDGKRLARILVTHLHSYATPLIRYDIGDMGILLQSCPCGHRGPTLTEVYGRRKMFLRHPDGRLQKFYFVAKVFRDVIEFSEISFKQTGEATILLQLRREAELTTDEERRARQLLSHWFGDDFNMMIRVVREIDWSRNPKRLLFVNELT